MKLLQACFECAKCGWIQGAADRTAGDFFEAELLVKCSKCSKVLGKTHVSVAYNEMKITEFNRVLWQQFKDLGLIETPLQVQELVARLNIETREYERKRKMNRGYGS